MFALALLAAACGPFGARPETTFHTSPPAALSSSERPSTMVGAKFVDLRRWHLRPDGLTPDSNVPISVVFDSDPAGRSPTVRVRDASEVPLRPTGTSNAFSATIDLKSVAPGRHVVDVMEHLATSDVAAVSAEIIVSEPEYVVWTLDFEGDAAGDAELANTAAIADRFHVPMTLMWNPRVWTTTQVSAARADAMLAWVKERAAKGDEVALHLHMWTDFVRAAGVTPRTTPSWGGRGDGYDVPMTAFNEAEVRVLLDYSILRMLEHGLPRPVTFRAGGQFADATTVRAVSGAGFIADCSAVPAGTFGQLRYPWTLTADAQPYHPSPSDANAAGDLPLLEAPTIGGNTFGHTTASIAPIVRADLSFVAPAGEIARERRAITLVSHPGTIVVSERAAIETLFAAFDPLRYDADAGPLRFVTLAQLAKAWR